MENEIPPKITQNIQNNG